jgi:hypothetical protein
MNVGCEIKQANETTKKNPVSEKDPVSETKELK